MVTLLLRSEEHKKHSPKCSFVKIGKPESDLTIDELLSIAEEVDANLLVSMVEIFINYILSARIEYSLYCRNSIFSNTSKNWKNYEQQQKTSYL